MIVRTGDMARELLEAAHKHDYLDADPKVYDYRVTHGAVLIRRESHECLYIKTTGSKAGHAIALQGMPDEFLRHREKLEGTFKEMEIVNWDEVKEMIAWAPMVPQF